MNFGNSNKTVTPNQKVAGSLQSINEESILFDKTEDLGNETAEFSPEVPNEVFSSTKIIQQLYNSKLSKGMSTDSHEIPNETSAHKNA